MKFTIIARKFDLTDKVKDYVEKKLGKLDKFFKDDYLSCPEKDRNLWNKMKI